jgi:hypothetical protein
VLTLVPVLVGAALLGSPAFAADISGSDPAGDVKTKGLTAAERAALDVVSVRVVGESGLGVFVTATFRGNFEKRVGRGHLKTALAALVLVPKPGAGVPAGVVTAGKGPVGTVLARTSSETVGAVRDGRTVTFFVGGPGFESVESVEVRTLAKAPGLAGRASARAHDVPEVPDGMWDKILESPSDILDLPGDASFLTCLELRELREEIRKRNGADFQLLVEDELRSDRCSYPFVRGWHYEGTPVALLLYDGGPNIGPIVVMTLYNLDGIVPGSHVGVITTAHDAVGEWRRKADALLLEVFGRPGQAGAIPDLSRLPIDLPLPPSLEEVPAKTILELQSLSTHFIFFENDETGVRKLVSNPVISGTQLIPGTAIFQISGAAPFEIFPIGQDGRTNPAAKEELPQPPLTPELDEAERLIDLAFSDEADALGAQTFPEMRKLIGMSVSYLNEALAVLEEAQKAGELPGVYVTSLIIPAARLRDERALRALNDERLGDEEKERTVKAHVREALTVKEDALEAIRRARALRQAGK